MIGSRSLHQPSQPWRRLAAYVVPALVVVLVAALAWLQPAGSADGDFPAAWNLGLREPVDDFQSWVIGNRANHPAFRYVLDPFSDAVDFSLRRVEAGLLAVPWPVLLAAAGLLGYYLGGWRLAGLAAGGLAFMGLVDLWVESLQTLALMGVAVALALLIGVPIGIWCARSNLVDALVRPVLDAMQTMPAFVYLIPVLLFFGVARVPAVVATVIYALPPAIRLTNLGIRQVSPQAVEAARSFGSTPRQLLFKVQLPLALPTLLAGVNQTIMMALGIVVIAALIGAGGLGREVMISLQRLRVGRAFEAGLSIVFLAIILDRLSEGFSRLDLTAPPRRAPAAGWRASALRAWYALPDLLAALAGAALRALRRPGGAERAPAAFRRHSFLINSLVILAGLWLFEGVAYAGTFPEAWQVGLARPIDGLVGWMRDNLFEFQVGGATMGTGPLSDFVTLQVLNPLRRLFVDWLPWPVVVLGGMLLGFTAGGWRLAVLAAACLFGLGLLGMWEPSMDTFSQVLAAVVATSLIAFPVAVLTSRSDRLQAWLRPLLDTLQTIPSFVFLVPVIMLFNVGRVPGLIASVLYALPPGIKLIDLGIRQVAGESVEAAQAFGSTEWQTLVKVKLPLALPAIMLGINQIIMMVLAMVVIAGLVGGAGLGLEAVTGLARNETGRGLEAGLAIVLLAIVLDRITQAFARRSSY